MHLARHAGRISPLLEESNGCSIRTSIKESASMTEPASEESLDLRKIDDPYWVPPLSGGSPYRVNPITGGIEFLSPPGTAPVTSEDVRRWLEDFP
jgi:hypothetical protein